jgi:predicted CoA-substrate-specific enzyme activase
MVYAGIDAGSRTIKIVLLDGKTHKVLASGSADQGVEQEALAQALLERLLQEKGLRRRDVARTIATGYGRNIIRFADTTITEITCHARGVHHQSPKARTVVEIGGQDSKLLKLDENGAVRDFAMNDRCAAGTGRFLEMVATRLKVELDDLGRLAAKSRNPAVISSMCAVFAETEIVGLLAGGAKVEDVIAGAQSAIASRIVAMAGRDLAPPICFTGGVAMVSGMEEALKTALGHAVHIARDPLMTGALGAALLAASQHKT